MKNNIKFIREEQQKTQKDCANELGITLRAWQTYEQGVSEPKQELLIKIADMFGVSIDFLLGREPAPNPLGAVGLSEQSEAAVLEKYMSLPAEIRAVVLDVMMQLADAGKPPKASEVANENVESI